MHASPPHLCNTIGSLSFPLPPLLSLSYIHPPNLSPPLPFSLPHTHPPPPPLPPPHFRLSLPPSFPPPSLSLPPHMVSMGATRSRLAMSTPSSASNAVRMRAKLGSPFNPVRLKNLKNPMRSSLEMACMSLGAPVSDWRPAPMVERSAPIRMTQGEGQARRETVSPLA